MRTFGQEFYSKGKMVEEIEIKDLANAIPYKLDYILFDACLMATVEVAWELRNVCDYLAVSPCEIPAAGFDFRNLVIWAAGFALYRWFMTMDIPVGNTLPDMAATMALCFAAKGLKLPERAK